MLEEAIEGCRSLPDEQIMAPRYRCRISPDIVSMPTTTSSDILAELASLGTEQTLRTWRRHGVEGDAFGVLTAALDKIRKRVGTDHELALDLWKGGNHDARVLATMIADAARLGASDLQGMASELRNAVITDAFAALASRSPHARDLSAEWRRSDDEWIARAGGLMLARLARETEALTDEMLEEDVTVIECSIHASRNRVRDAMNAALIAIGVRNERLKVLALTAAAKIGPVEVDHGDTSCKTPDAATYIAKTAAHNAARAEKAAAKATRPSASGAKPRVAKGQARGR